jgi:hypothetical protein
MPIIRSYVRMSLDRLKGSRFAFLPMKIGDHVYIGEKSIIQAAQIGSEFEMGTILWTPPPPRVLKAFSLPFSFPQSLLRVSPF